jgi:hypothetical protein
MENVVWCGGSSARPDCGCHFNGARNTEVERWFAILTSREIRRGSFASAKDLVARITAFVAA